MKTKEKFIIISYQGSDTQEMRAFHIYISRFCGVRPRKGIRIGFHVFEINESFGISVMFFTEDGADSMTHEFEKCATLHGLYGIFESSNYAIPLNFFSSNLQNARDSFIYALNTYLNKNAELMIEQNYHPQSEDDFEISFTLKIADYEDKISLPYDDQLKKFFDIVDGEE